MARSGLLVAALLGATGVGLGAYHAHGLEAMLVQSGASPEEVVQRMQHCETAVRYQMYHALALVAVSILALRGGSTRALQVAGLLFVLGTMGFSGGLYLSVFTGNLIHFAIVPSGGVLLILGWIVFGAAGLGARPAQMDG